MVSGSIVALVTPFDTEGKVDFPALEALIRFQIEEGTDGLVLCGSTGEGSSLSKEEKCAIFQKAVEIAGSKLTLIAATGTNVTHESVELTQEAKKIGVDGCIAIVPYYLKPTPEGCFLHFAEIARVGLPFIVYHHPGRTGTKLSADALAAICEIKEVIAIKDATADLQLAQEILQKTQTPLFCGDDTLALASFSLGFKGSISIVGNVIPREWKVFVDAALKGDFIQARKRYSELYPLCQAMVLETNPQCVKFAVSEMGKCSPRMRLPLIEPQISNQQKIRVAFQSRGLRLKSVFSDSVTG